MRSLPLPILLVVAVGGCLTAYNRPTVRRDEGAPALEPRAAGCHVDIVEDGQAIDRPHQEFARVTLDWPSDKLKEQGPEGAIATLRAAACEAGAFFVKDLRALPRGTTNGGLFYEATFATLLGDDGRPLNLIRGADDAGSPP